MMALHGITSNTFLLLLCLFTAAFLYASIGHGGASGYLAVLALFGLGMHDIKVSVLLLNLLVSFISFYQYRKGGYFQWKLFWPFAIISIPASFIGALLPVHAAVYEKLLGLCLLISVVRITGMIKTSPKDLKTPAWWQMLGTGGSIGFLAGILGIGGGVLLSPIMLLCRWGDIKQTAAISAAFIFVNSFAGLLGTGIQGMVINPEIGWWMAAAFIGGLSGAYLGSHHFNFKALRYILGVVLILASYKLLMA